MPVNFQRVQSVFQAVVDLPPAARAVVLENACDDAEVRRQVEALLKAHDNSDELPPAVPDRTGTYLPATAEPGKIFAGRYKLREKLGEGGMGAVFVADQTEPVTRRVAVKIIKTGVESARTLARFEQERQALALMDHPNIAKVFDAGIDATGTQYFAMELVKGLSLTKYCDEAKLSPKERLELFVPICQAVQHAHQKGIIHRDLKPSNILVGLYDGRPVPKVIDFGVAKATGPRLTDQSIYTEVGSLIGTLEYMSPEQAELNNLDIDSRSDIYALGVILYELLTGSVPFSRKELQQAGLAEMLRVIKESEPPKPSTKLSGSGTLPGIAAARHTEPKKLTALVRGELDWIVMKALDKDRSRRYETANGFAVDVRRYLSGEAVLAAPASATYRLRKFARKNRVLLSTAAMVAVLLLAGIAGTTFGMIRANRSADAERTARKDAEEQQQKAEESAQAQRQAKETAEKRSTQIAKGVQLLAGILAAIDPTKEDQNEPIYVLLRRKAELAAKDLEAESVGDPVAVARLQTILGCTLHSLGSDREAIKLMEKSHATRERLLGPDNVDTLDTLSFLAPAYDSVGRLPEAIRLTERVRDAWLKVLGADHDYTLTMTNNLGVLYNRDGRHAEAIRLLEQVRDVRTKRDGGEDKVTLTVLSNLGMAYHDAGRNAEAIALLEHVRDAQTKALGPDHILTLHTLGHLATAYESDGRTADAMPLREESLKGLEAKLGSSHPFTLSAMQRSAFLHEHVGRYADAVRLGERAYDGCRKNLGADHESALGAMNNLASIYSEVGRYPEAIRLLEQLRKIRRETLSESHKLTLQASNNLGYVYNRAGRYPEAVAIMEPTRDLAVKALGPEHRDALFSMQNLAVAYCNADRLPEAIALFERVREIRTRTQGAENPSTVYTLAALADAYRKADRLPESIQLFEKVRDLEVKKYGATNPITLTTLNNLGLAYLDAGRTDEAVKLYEPLAEIRMELNGPENPITLIVRNNLALAYLRAGRVPEAMKMYEDLLKVIEKKHGPENPLTTMTKHNLASSYTYAGRLPESIKLNEEAYKARAKDLGPNSSGTLTTACNLADNYRDVGRLPEAIKLYEKILAVREKTPGPNHAETLHTLEWGAIPLVRRFLGNLQRGPGFSAGSYERGKRNRHKYHKCRSLRFN